MFQDRKPTTGHDKSGTELVDLIRNNWQGILDAMSSCNTLCLVRSRTVLNPNVLKEQLTLI
jgi:hypothetical protein